MAFQLDTIVGYGDAVAQGGMMRHMQDNFSEATLRREAKRMEKAGMKRHTHPTYEAVLFALERSTSTNR